MYSSFVRQVIHASETAFGLARMFPTLEETQAALRHVEEVRARNREIDALLNVIHAMVINKLNQLAAVKERGL